jgi:2-phospho-L-lactate transferase/gluconeogenesis factor (CofD/UPF0052 family)
VNLPFLKTREVPKLRRMSGISKYGFSEDDDLIENSLDELISALESKDHKSFVQALKALIQCVKNKEESNAADSFKEA